MDFTTTSRVILSGASGMLGKAVRRALDTNLIPSLQLVRRKRARPDPVTNADFTRVLARRLRRPAFLSVPQFAMKLLFGQMANEALLARACVKPRKLLDAGFHFSQPNLDQALAAALRK
jgi:hypothetical protein